MSSRERKLVSHGTLSIGRGVAAPATACFIRVSHLLLLFQACFRVVSDLFQTCFRLVSDLFQTCSEVPVVFVVLVILVALVVLVEHVVLVVLVLLAVPLGGGAFQTNFGHLGGKGSNLGFRHLGGNKTET